MILAALNRALTVAENTIAALLLAAVLIIVTWELAIRGLLGESHLWTDEMSRMLLIALVYMAAVGLTRDGAHVRIELLHNALGPRGQALLERLSDLLCLVFAVAATWLGIGLVQETRMFGISFAHSNLPFDLWVAQLAIPIAFGLMTLRLALRLLGVRPTADHPVQEG